MHGSASGQDTYEALLKDAETTDLKWKPILDGGVRPSSLFFAHTKQNISCKCSYGGLNCAKMELLHIDIPNNGPIINSNHNNQ